MSDVHDMTKRGWGNDLSFTPDKDPKTATARGWRSGINQGDHLMLNNPASPFGVSYYLVESIKYYADPPDMFAAALRWIPFAKCKALVTNENTLRAMEGEWDE